MVNTYICHNRLDKVNYSRLMLTNHGAAWDSTDVLEQGVASPLFPEVFLLLDTTALGVGGQPLFLPLLILLDGDGKLQAQHGGLLLDKGEIEVLEHLLDTSGDLLVLRSNNVGVHNTAGGV